MTPVLQSWFEDSLSSDLAYDTIATGYSVWQWLLIQRVRSINQEKKYVLMYIRLQYSQYGRQNLKTTGS